jgi:hypothetical protein
MFVRKWHVDIDLADINTTTEYFSPTFWFIQEPFIFHQEGLPGEFRVKAESPRPVLCTLNDLINVLGVY